MLCPQLCVPKRPPKKSSRLRFYGCLIFGAGVMKVLTSESTVFQTGSAMDEVWFRMWTKQRLNILSQRWLVGKSSFGLQCITWQCNYTVQALRKFSTEHRKQLREQLRKTWKLNKPHYIVTVPKKQCVGKKKKKKKKTFLNFQAVTL